MLLTITTTHHPASDLSYLLHKHPGNHEEGKMRHADHRFEWTRNQFEDWGNSITGRYNYTVTFSPVGEADDEVGALSQMAVCKVSDNT